MAKKITYSKRPNPKRHVPFDHDSAPDAIGNYKRPKTDEFRLPHTPPKGRSEKQHSLVKKSLKFGGPTSMPDEEVDVEMASVRRKNLAVFDKILNQPHQLPKPRQSSIHGSLEDFKATMSAAKQSRSNYTRPQESYLPTPPMEDQRKARQDYRSPAFSEAIGLTVKAMEQAQYGSGIPRDISQGTTHDPRKEMYQPKTYKAVETVPPRRDLLGYRLRKKSTEARLWSVNQTSSPFLRLPGEIRNAIYEHALGGKTINIGYETYRTTYKKDEPHEVIPIFKYRCTVFDCKGKNPFNTMRHPWISVSSPLTLLNNICRQLYMETAILPYALNTLAFDAHSTMFNMLYIEKRLSRCQLNAITHLVLPDLLPQPNMLTYLGNLEHVNLGKDYKDLQKGLYKVIRREGEDPELVLKSDLDRRRYLHGSGGY